LDFSDEKCTRIRVYVGIKIGTPGPSVGEIIKFYVVRGDGDPVSPHTDDGLGTVDAAVGTEPSNSDLVGTLVIPSTATNATYYTSFTVDLPGDLVSLVLWNGSATAALSATNSDHYVRYRTSSLEA